MRICYLTAGAAGMFCGSCMHDNALASALIARGVDCMLVPVYTPIRTDEEDVSIDRVFFGGINVFLQQKAPWLSYLPRWADHALSHPRLIRWLTKNTGKTDPKFLGALTVSMLRGMEGNQRKEVRRLVEWLKTNSHPDVLLLTNFLIGGCIPEAKRQLDCPVVVTLQGDDIFFDFLPEPYRSQTISALQKLVPQVDRFISHSERYAKLMAEALKIPDSKIEVTPLGIDVEDLPTPASRTAQRPFTIGYLARLSPEKGLHRLIDGFIESCRLEESNASPTQHRLEIAGWLGPQHEEFWASQQKKIEAAGLSSRVHYWGSISRQQKNQFLKSIDLITVPTEYEEPKGLYIFEAAASGIRYLQPSHGAFPETHARLNHGNLLPNDHFNDQQKFGEEILRLVQEAAAEPRSVDLSVNETIRKEISIDTMAERTERLLVNCLDSRSV